jgi:hypothetical protein
VSGSSEVKRRGGGCESPYVVVVGWEKVGEMSSAGMSS